MMEESAVDIENPPPVTASKTNPHNNTPDRNNKIKILLLSAFLLVVIVLSVALGVTLQGNPTNNVEGVGDGEEGKLHYLVAT
mmetsp:Transcript_1478/g.2492  ORF Transcript_1478/g.2492 Transcript_1478/m.2492 type:complete len:82 (-) Transcript_1478:565-810(-)